MRVAILAFDGFNEFDCFLPLGLLNRLADLGWKAELASPSSHVTSMNGVTVQAQRALEFANEADAVIFGGGLYARAIAENSALLDRLQLDPLRQLIGGQGSGTLLLARLGLLGDTPACTDSATKPWVVEAGVRVIEAPFHCRGPVATAGGGMAAQYLAAWMMLRGAGRQAAARALAQTAPVGETAQYVDRVLAVVSPRDAADRNRPAGS
ncbi:DJ-1/PfpI family protein [Piscinibacter sakaiensis]|uniref:DJ-1/PfpI family protein n=1 Tax=Piscinibacter sakaiensis TaxID=1547922 RepID=UPI003AAC1DA8